MPPENSASRTDPSLEGVLKEIFEHLRNIGLCAVLFIAGRVTLQHQEWFDFTLFGTNRPFFLGATFIGYLNIVVAVSLLLLNSLRFVVLLLTVPIAGNEPENKLMVWGRWGLVAIYALVVYSMVLVTMQLQLR